MLPHGLRRSVNPRHPVAKAICDGCGFAFNHPALSWQMEWAGAALINTQMLVCQGCLDLPNPGNRAIILRPDPVPIRDPRPENYAAEENGGRMFLEIASASSLNAISMQLENGALMFLEST